MDKRGVAMFSRKILALILIIVGVVILAYSGITLKTPGKPVDIGPIHVSTTNRHFIPPVAGGVALGAGLLILVLWRKQS